MDLEKRVADMELRLRNIQDRQEIYDCLMRYCRGVDRNDRELMLSAYHADAIDDHGAFCDLAANIVDSALAFHNENHARTQHAVSNVIYDIQGDTAHCETYWLYAGHNKKRPPDCSVMGGRYLDRFERRNGQWRIALRISIIDWHGVPGAPQAPPEGLEVFNAGFPPTRDRNDPSFMRPLKVSKERMGTGTPGWKK